MSDVVHEPNCRKCEAPILWARNRKRHHVPLVHAAQIAAALEKRPTLTVEELQAQYGGEARRHQCS